jgi:hypothetical protein
MDTLHILLRQGAEIFRTAAATCALLLIPAPLLCADPASAPPLPGGSTIAQAPPGAAGKSTELYDIKGPVMIADKTTTLLIGAGIILAVLLAVLLFFLWKKRTRKERARTAHEKALQRLIEAQELLQAEQTRAFVTLVDDILRSYIEERFGVSARRQTTREFIETLERTSNGPDTLLEHKPYLQTWLSQCDQVKFARATLDKKLMEAMLANLRSFIEATKVEPEK